MPSSKYKKLPYFPTQEKLVDILCDRTQNNDRTFFRLIVSFYFTTLASAMRINVELAGNQKIPVNMYVVNLATSGHGKSLSVGIMEDEVTQIFRTVFLDSTFIRIAEKNLIRIALHRATKNGTDPDFEKELIENEFRLQGALLFSFDSGTSAAIKQMRNKLLMAGAGSMNLIIDEMGSNMLGNTEILDNYLELFDKGKIKQKLIKNTKESIRSEDISGTTPTNMLLFGTPVKLFNGSKTEDEFFEMTESGYARRCFYGFTKHRATPKTRTAKDLYDMYNNTASSAFMATLATELGKLADPAHFGQTIKMKRPVGEALMEYRIACEDKADTYSEYEESRKAELSHRYFKVLKLMATYAFIDKSVYATQVHLDNAIAMAEMSGECFDSLMVRDRPHVKLAKYLAMTHREVTQADLIEDLPFYRGSEMQKREILNLAIAHGYKNCIYIKKEHVDGIEFFSGKTVDETNLNKMTVSYSNDIAVNYKNVEPAFDKMHKMIDVNGLHWVNHHLLKGHRREDNCVEGFNMVVLDVEKSVSIDVAKSLLFEYKWLLHVTKRHTAEDHRYRIIMPLSHKLELNPEEYKEFMRNLYAWLPFALDEVTNQRARKWLTHKGDFWYNDGTLLDAMQFIPKTKKAEAIEQLRSTQGSLSHLEKWFINNTASGNRNHQILRYAYALMDRGYDFDGIRNSVFALNDKLTDPLSETELLSTVLVTISKKLATK